MTPPAHLSERYGRRRGGARAGLVVLAVLLAGMLGVAVWAGVQLADPPVRFGLVAYGAQTPKSIEATIEVVRRAGDIVTCELSAIDAQFRVAGQRTVRLADPQPLRSRVTVTIETLGPAVAVRLDGCRVAGGSASAAEVRMGRDNDPLVRIVVRPDAASPR